MVTRDGKSYRNDGLVLSDTTSYNQDFPIDLKNGLFAACNSVQYIALFVNHAQFQCFFIGRYYGKARFGTAKNGTFNRVDFAAERT